MKNHNYTKHLLILAAIVATVALAAFMITGSDTEDQQNESAQSQAASESSEETLTEPAVLASEQLDAGMRARQAEFESKDPEYPDEERVLYVFNEDGSSTPELHPADALLWDIVQELAPTEEVKKSVAEFEIFYDEEDDTLASVEAIGEANETWLYSINYIAVTDFEELIPTIVHEYAHILSLQDAQTTTESEDANITSSCQNYLVVEGCLNDGSYLGGFYDRFWKGQPFDQEEDRTYEETLQLFAETDATFVSDYATTNPVEDFAESFMAYVMRDEVNGDAIDQQKMQYFEQFEELVQYRNTTRATVAGWAGQ